MTDPTEPRAPQPDPAAPDSLEGFLEAAFESSTSQPRSVLTALEQRTSCRLGVRVVDPGAPRPGAAAEAGSEPGARYRVLDEVGRGGMGAVFRGATPT